MDEDYMRQALEQAKLAAAAGELPVGCVIVKDGEIIARAHNECEQRGDATAHAELLAIQRASAAAGGWRLNDCALYVTLEPCPMCAGAVINSRVERVVYGATDFSFGSVKSVQQIFSLPYNHQPAVTDGVLAEECTALLREFFRRLRLKRGAQ